MSVETTRVATEDIDVVVHAVGTLAAEKSIELRAKRSGIVRALPLVEGNEVPEGAILVQLDDREERARVDHARASLTAAEVRSRNTRVQFDRTQRLHKDGVASQQQLDDLRAELDSAMAALDVARANVQVAESQLADTVVRAPFRGIVGRRQLDLGAYVKESEAIASLVDLDPVELVFSIPERHLAQLAQGLTVSVTVPSQPDRAYEGKVSFIDPAVDRVNRTVTVKAVLANPEHELRPGQFTTASIRLERRSGATVVPEDAVASAGDRSLVYVVRDGMATAKQVETGVRLAGRVEIRSGLEPGDTIVRSGHEKLRPDAPLPVSEAPSPDVARKQEG